MNLCAERWKAAIKQKKLTCAAKALIFAKAALPARKQANVMQQADVICFASPVYFYDMCGQLKTFLDRTNPLFPAEYNFTDIYFLLTAADTEQSASEGPLKGLQGWIDCFENAGLKGVVCGLGAEKPGDVKSMPAMNEAYMLGKQA